MKTEDIDKRIGMPDVNAEWTKFEREVIGNSPAGGKPKAKLITRKPIEADSTELESNRRSRSAKLRVLEKL